MNNEKIFKPKKFKISLLIKKYNSYFDKEKKIIHEINKYLNNKEMLESNDNILLNKLVKSRSPRYDKNLKVIPYSFVGPQKIFDLNRRKGIKDRTPLTLNKIIDNNNLIKNYIKSNDDDNDNTNDIKDEEYNNIKTFEKKISIKVNETDNKFDYFKVVDNEDLSNIYKNIKNNIKKNHSKNNTIYNINKNNDESIYIKTFRGKLYSDNLRHILFKQEKILKKNINFERITQKINKFIQKKTHKINKELLTNKINNYSIKNKFYQTSRNNNTRNWYNNLRNPLINGLYRSNGYFKTNNSLNDELYSTINLNKKNEIFVNPLKKGKANSVNKAEGKINKINKIIEKIKSLENLSIKGYNLFEFESKNEMKIKGQKKLYNKIKLDELVYKEENKDKKSFLDIENNLKEFYKDKIFSFNYKDNYSSKSDKKLIY